MVTKYCGKRGEIAPKEQFLLFSTLFSIPTCISNLRSQITYSFVKCGWSIHFFLNSANLICLGTDISKYSRESLGLPDNKKSTLLRILNPAGSTAKANAK